MIVYSDADMGFPYTLRRSLFLGSNGGDSLGAK